MSVIFDNPNKTYIKSNARTVMHFLWFVCGIFSMLVAGLCVFVIFGRDDTNNYHLDSTGKFYYQLSNNQVTLVKYIDRDAESFNVPDSVNYGGKSYEVTKIGANAFSNNRQLTQIKISDNVTEILGDNTGQTGAFSGCIALTNLELGRSITRIGSFAFKNCIALRGVDLPESVQFIDDGAFQGCLKLQTVGLKSNGVLGMNCFENCINVTTLNLADNVRLNDNHKREVLSSMLKLSNFKINASNSTYYVQQAGNGQCLMQGNVVVLGGYGAEVPGDAEQILNWAWGERASGTLFVPSTVTKVDINSLCCGEDVAICTDAEGKPDGWLTKVPVYTHAQQITFKSGLDDVADVSAYVYQVDNVPVKPSYDELFPNVKTNTPFNKWQESGNVYTAQYKSEAVATIADQNEFVDELNQAESYLLNANLRLKFTLEFWEDFKNIYYQGRQLCNETEPYQYAVKECTRKLKEINQQIEGLDETVLESTSWYVGLQNLVNAIKNLNKSDLSDTVTAEQLRVLELHAREATTLIAEHDSITEETGKKSWLTLREMYENLLVNCGVESPLQKEIYICDKLNRVDYSVESWQKMQDQLEIAKQITEHNLSISVVRKALESARKNLRESNLADSFTQLDVWLSICRALPKADYESDSYNNLQDGLVKIALEINGMENNHQVENAVNRLFSYYNNLIAVNDFTEYQNSTGILNKNSIVFFITAVVLFTVAVGTGAKAAALRKQLRQTQE